LYAFFAAVAFTSAFCAAVTAAAAAVAAVCALAVFFVAAAAFEAALAAAAWIDAARAAAFCAAEHFVAWQHYSSVPVQQMMTHLFPKEQPDLLPFSQIA